MQWHPLFAHLLRLVLADYYEIRTNLPVGDLPREADITLLRRLAPAPFVGIWRHLTVWNVQEFKGPTDSPAVRDLDLLAEVGLGIDRRLNEERQQQGQPIMPREEVSWWYLANHLGTRFLAEAERLLRQVPEPLGDGLWRASILGHPLLLVSRDALPVEQDSIPLHLVTQESAAQSRALANLVAAQRASWEAFGPFMLPLHPEEWKEIERMNPTALREFGFDIQPVVDYLGLQKVIDQIGLKRVIDQVGIKQVVDQVGIKQVVDQVGIKQVLEAIGPEALVAGATADGWLAHLSPEQRQELKRRLE